MQYNHLKIGTNLIYNYIYKIGQERKKLVQLKNPLSSFSLFLSPLFLFLSLLHLSSISLSVFPPCPLSSPPPPSPLSLSLSLLSLVFFPPSLSLSSLSHPLYITSLPSISCSPVVCPSTLVFTQSLHTICHCTVLLSVWF